VALNLLKEFDRAISEFQEAISIQENIIANDPKNAFAADNLRDSYSGIAIAFREKNAFPESEGFFRKALKLDSGRIRAHADTLQRLYNASIRMEFAELLMKRAKGAENSDLQEARSELQTALQIFETSSLEGNLDPAMAGAFERTKELLANIQRS
jgi:tetratricopeptide (TPR) repeat protein